jgi:hypothetical protein
MNPCYGIRAQSKAVNEVPFQFLSIFQSPYYQNSSVKKHSSIKEAAVLYTGRAGLFSNVRTVGFYLYSNLNKPPSDSMKVFKHFLGVNAMSIQEGELFRKNRITLAYTPSIPIGKGEWSTSIRAGLVSYSFQSTDYSSGGADTKWNFDVFSAYKRSSTVVAIGIHDVSNIFLTPVEEKYYLNRYFSLLGIQIFRLRNGNEIECSLNNFYFPQSRMKSIQASAAYRWRNKFSIGGFYHSFTKSTGTILSIDKIQIKQSVFRIHASYRSPSLFISGSRFNFYELMLVYGFESYKRNSVIDEDARHKRLQPISLLRD